MPVTQASQPSLLELDDSALATLVGPPPYRVRQVKRWLYRACAETAADMTDLPKSLRSTLEDVGVGVLVPVAERHGDGGMTTKWLYSSRGAELETVLMRYPGRATVCVSSQAGCAMGCPFCATGQDGFQRQLSSGEIVEQVIRTQRRLRGRAGADGPDHVTNVVFMGMGEPLANYGNVVTAIRRLHDDAGIGARSLTLSTIGIPDRIRTLARDVPPVTLAWSLHAADDVLRDELVPANRRWPIASIVAAIEEYRDAGGRRVTIEYTLMDGVNDGPRQAAGVAALARRLHAHVNCIRMNPTPDPRFRPAPEPAVERFVAELTRHGANVTLRRNRGSDIDGACGQLRTRHGIAMRPALGVPAR